ncbi:DUF1836 domain-containing protein [Lutispora sp.]|uniref:DUF1836 domain-containing protein n=1 Tax=Lutispora sp. TaxID=2828727 RepID=UPI002B20AB79|nr:DUF1836 domain-containing protein [Lutispora sp.]MEA4962137.1 DUF1836 domain-containing protein [Lutispora sp.]
MNREELDKIIEYIASSGDIQLSDIPCIDLYVDQVTTLFDDKLADTKRQASDKILTKTMINNYTKAKAVMPPKNKKYGRNHIILLSLIYNLKQILSINDIKILLTPLLGGINPSKGNERFDLDELYSNYLEIKREDLNNLPKQFNDMLNHIADKSAVLSSSSNGKAELMLLVLTLANQAATSKRLAEMIIDEFLKSDL